MQISLYSDNPSQSLNIERIVEFLKTFEIKSEFKGDLNEFLDLSEKEVDEFKKSLDSMRVVDIEKPVDEIEENISYDEFFQAGKNIKRFLYDANWFQRILYKLFHSKLSDNNGLNIIFTDKLFGTFGSRRYHARVVLTGQPTLISTSGLVEAPARPREYYFAKASLLQSGRSTDELDEIYKNKFLDYDDERITKIICAYTLQPIIYYFFGKEFCEDKSCSLFNSHWQEEVLNIQFKGKVCNECSEIIEKIKQ